MVCPCSVPAVRNLLPVHFTETSLAQIEPWVAFINTEQCVQLCWSQEAVTGAMIGNVTRPTRAHDYYLLPKRHGFPSHV
jgi:hypothetical protein